MSLKVPRGFVTESEDAIAARYAQMRVAQTNQEIIARRRAADRKNASLVFKAMGVVVVLTAAVVIFKNIQLLASFF